MKKFLEYGLIAFCWLNAAVCFAENKFDILPDLPDPLAAYAQPAEASSVKGGTDMSAIVGGGSVGHDMDILHVFVALLFTILLIYASLIIVAKIKKSSFDTLRKAGHDVAKSQAFVVSTTALGNNKTLHVVELDGKRMLIGASSGAIQLLKDLGSVDRSEGEEDFSQIEIPTIKIPRIEIPKIEIPTIGFSKLMTKIHKEMGDGADKSGDEAAKEEAENFDETQTSENIIDSLFTKTQEAQDSEDDTEDGKVHQAHKVDPDDYALYKKYLS